MVVARTLEAHTALVAALAAREISREYLAICTGVMTGGGTIDQPIGRHRTQRIRMAVRADGRPAVTHYRVVRRFRAHTLVRVNLETGRTHQIRVHLAHAGFPVVGDPVYGGRRRLPAGCYPGAGAGADELPAPGAARGAPGPGASGERPGTCVGGPASRGHARAPGGAGSRRRVSEPAQGALACLEPAWPAPATVRAAFTLRCGGVSAAPFDTLNVGAHVGDLPRHVGENRARVRAALALPHEPRWLEQVHGRDVVEIRAADPDTRPRADAVIARERGAVAVVQVADCLPVLFAAADGSCVAAAHAGWRGLAAGVLEATLRAAGR